MMRKILLIFPFLFLGIIIFRAWFSMGLITAGDFWSVFNSMYATKPLPLYAWDLESGAGMGAFVGPLLWVYLNFGIAYTFFGKILGLNWIIIERIFYFFPFIIFSVLSSYKLMSLIFKKNIFSIFAVFIYCFNSYILMVVGGGQNAGIGMAYSLVPLVLYYFIQIFKQVDIEDNNKAIKYSLISSLLLSVQIIFDLRIGYITLFAISIFSILKILKNKNMKNFLMIIFYVYIIPGFFTLLINSFWILPTVLSRRNPIDQLGAAYSSVDAVKFFSFAKFENSLGLMHPNWPENIFGKVSFMRPEFLILPILAFSSLFHISKERVEERQYLIFFVILGLVGIFLAKGASDPFGGIYIWMFENIPGFNMFRDPTKWYVLIATSYSVLITYFLSQTYIYLKSKFN